MNISLGCCEKSHIPYACKHIIIIGTYLQNHLKNFKILLEYRLPYFMSIPISSVTSMSFINRWTLPCFMSILISSVTSMSFINRWTSASCSSVMIKTPFQLVCSCLILIRKRKSETKLQLFAQSQSFCATFYS